MDVYAHRAGRGLGPENTLEACALSLNYPIDFIDFDIVMTRDEQFVALHDLVLNPDITRDHDGKFITEQITVHNLTFSELAQYNVGSINPSCRYASYFPMQRTLAVARIPLLKEAIGFIQRKNPSVGFQFEIKTRPAQPHLSPAPEKLAGVLASLLEEAGIIHQTEVQSFDYRCLIEIKKLNPLIKTAFLSHPTHLAGYDLAQFGGSYPQLIHAIGGACWEPFEMELTREALEEAHALGLKVVAWGYPEKEGTDFNAPQITKLISWGIDGIITDRPDALWNILRQDGRSP